MLFALAESRFVGRECSWTGHNYQSHTAWTRNAVATVMEATGANVGAGLYGATAAAQIQNTDTRVRQPLVFGVWTGAARVRALKGSEQGRLAYLENG